MSVSTKTKVRQASDALLGTVSTTSVPVSLRAVATGGASLYRKLGLTATKDEVKATAGTLYSITLENVNAAVRYVKVYNAAAANVTVGTTTPVMTIRMAATSIATYSFPNGIDFSAGITVASVTELADNGTTGASANETIVHITYK
jgi:hypothetical protein